MDEAEDVSGCWVTVLWRFTLFLCFLAGGFKALTGKDWDGGSCRLLWGERWSIDSTDFTMFLHTSHCVRILSLFSYSCGILLCSFLQLKGPLDHSHFDMFPPELEEPPEEFSGWDKDFWKRAVSKKKLFSQRRFDIKWWWTVSGGEVSVLPQCAFWSIVQLTDWLVQRDTNQV